MDQITVSFILPVYNMESYLTACLESIFSQSLQNYEIILVNDGSTDNSPGLCREYEAKYQNVRVLDQLNSGVSIARNNGLAAARGKYICFMDADDFYTMDFAKKFYDLCEQNNLDIIRGFYRFYDEDRQCFREIQPRQLSYYNQVLSGEAFLIKSMRENANEVVPVGGFFRRQYLLDNNIRFPEGIIFEEDQIFFLEALIKQTCRIMQTPIEFYAYRKHAGSATTTPTVKKARDAGTIVEMELALVSELKDKETRKAAKCYVGASFFQITCIYGRVPREDRKQIRAICDVRTKLICAAHASSWYEQVKNTLFAFAPCVLDLVYYFKLKD